MTAVARKNSSQGTVILVIFGGIAYLVSQFGKELLILGGLALGAWILYKVLSSSKSVAEPADSEDESSPEVRVTISTGSSDYDYRVTSRDGDSFWRAAGQFSKVSGFDIGGMVYVGSGLGAIGGDGAEPALIDPELRVAGDVDDCTMRRLSYWPSYSGASPEARAAYLRWLATGCKDPEADLGYVFLYFYGLERRALHDAKSSERAKGEIPAIQREVERLLALYSNRSFQGYAGSFVDFLRARNTAGRLYEGPPPPLSLGRYLDFSHRLGLAQCAADGRPLPAEWAYAWLAGDPNTRRRTPATRCPEEFKRLFIHKYQKLHGDGMVLPQNKTRLKLEYRPASPGFLQSRSDLEIQLDLPDISALSSPIKKLQAIAESSSSELEGYSRFIGKEKALAGTFSATMELPFALWPENFREPVMRAQALSSKGEGVASIAFAELRSWFDGWQDADRGQLEAFCRALGEAGVGMEPDPRFGGAVPDGDAPVVLFALGSDGPEQSASARYSAAALTLHLAAAVASTDNGISDAERGLLLKQLEQWLHLAEGERRRLQAHLHRFLSVPPKLTGLTKRIAALDKSARESLGNFLALVAQADAEVSPAEVKTLEKIFKLLGLDSKSVYSAVHEAAAEPITVRPAETTASGFAVPKRPERGTAAFKLDAAKVEELKADSERVAAILGTIFVEENIPAAALPKSQEVEHADEPSEPSLLSLDPDHSGFVRVLMARTHWSRSELEEIARDRELPLDGTMEHINDAAFEKFGKPFFEGDGDIELNPEVLKEISHVDHQAA